MRKISWYASNFEDRLKGRYIALEHIIPLLDSYKDFFEISIAGTSKLGRNIPLLKIGHGEKVVLGWSQMHGNESTTTKALFDFLKFIHQTVNFRQEIGRFLADFSFFIIPILNPDGSFLYTRENANSIDLNRDAQNLSQKESRVLREVFDRIKPNLCLNLHDQRSIYGLDSGLSSVVSFLAPSADEKRSITPSREVAMKHIVGMNNALQSIIPGQVGRYDDNFNKNCVGDTFQMAGVPTILFEAGHYQNDYNREKPREFVFYAFLNLFGFKLSNNIEASANDYFSIPENRVNQRDIILKNVRVDNYEELMDIAIQFSEVLRNETVYFDAIIDKIGDCTSYFGHKEIDLFREGILINSQVKFEEGQKISSIVKKSDNSVIIIL